MNFPKRVITAAIAFQVIATVAFAQSRVVLPARQAAHINGKVSNVPKKLGDINCDGVVGFGDIQPFIALLSSGEYLLEADINMDGSVDFVDIPSFIDLLAGA